MPVSIVVGAQYGSEGKGKVAFRLAREEGARLAVRVGGPNSGHTVVYQGQTRVLRQLPVAAWLPGTVCVLPPGSYLDPEVLRAELALTGLGPERLVIDPHAWLVGPADREVEAAWNEGSPIGSTRSGTGAAVARRISRQGPGTLAKHHPALAPYLRPALTALRDALDAGERVVIEGTQGSGLSLLHAEEYPHATSRDTTAAGFLAEAGLSPFDVDDVVLVARALPIRVAGPSGPLPGETTWEAVSRSAGRAVLEHTTVTRRVRRVGGFDAGLVRRAIALNRPSRVVLNHVDYLATDDLDRLAFVERVEAAIGRRVDLVGLGPDQTEARDRWAAELEARRPAAK